jgi:thioredoxin reductase (NADPH)
LSDWDAVIVGGGPAGLTAGLYLGRGKWHTLLLEKQSVGGYIMNIEMIENYPGFPEGIMGSQLGMEMRNQATKYGLEIKRTEVSSVQGSASSKWITCRDGDTYTASTIVLAGGSVPKKLGVPGEEEFRGRGVFSCAFCDGEQYADRIVTVCGGGDAGVTEALYLSRMVSKVILVEALPRLTATAVLQDRVKSNPKIEVHCGVRIKAILGNEEVEAVEYIDQERGEGTLQTNGVLVHIGLDPNTEYLEGVVPLDSQRQIKVDNWLESEIPGIFAAGDIRSDSPKQVSAAVGDGATAGIAANRFLQKL